MIRNNVIDPLPAGKRGGTSGIIANTAGNNVRIEGNLIDGSGSELRDLRAPAPRSRRGSSTAT